MLENRKILVLSITVSEDKAKVDFFVLMFLYLSKTAKMKKELTILPKTEFVSSFYEKER